MGRTPDGGAGKELVERFAVGGSANLHRIRAKVFEVKLRSGASLASATGLIAPLNFTVAQRMFGAMSFSKSGSAYFPGCSLKSFAVKMNSGNIRPRL